MDRAPRTVAPRIREPRVTCLRTEGGNSVWRVGYELPLAWLKRLGLIGYLSTKATELNDRGVRE